MTTKNVQLQDPKKNFDLMPKTLGSIVINNAGDNLGTVEAGAQVNIIEKIKINNQELTITNKTAEYTIPAAVAYSITKLDTPSTGAAATYQLAADGVPFGTKIDIPKDLVVSAGSVKKCTTKDTPVTGLNVGDPYIELELANSQDKIYIPVKDLVDVYTAGNGIDVSAANVISVDTTDTSIVDAAPTANSTKFVQSGGTHAAIKTVADALDTHEADAVKHITAAERTAWNAKQDAISDLATIRSNATDGKAAKDALDNDEYQTTLSATNKLSTDYIATSNSAMFVTATEKSTWDGKQDAISDLATIRSGAAAGATALQQSNVASTYSATGTAPVNGTAVASAIANKADKATTVDGYGILDGVTYVELA